MIELDVTCSYCDYIYDKNEVRKYLKMRDELNLYNEYKSEYIEIFKKCTQLLQIINPKINKTRLLNKLFNEYGNFLSQISDVQSLE